MYDLIQRFLSRATRSPVQATALLVVPLLLLAGCGSEGGMGSDPEPDAPSFDSGTLAPGETFSYEFEDTGTEYFCKIHETNMQGQITVDADADSSGTARVSMDNTSFQPAQLSVQPGTEVIWTNNDDLEHTSTSGNPSSDDNQDDGY